MNARRFWWIGLLVLLIGGWLILASLAPRAIDVSYTLVIDRPVSQVFPVVSNFEQRHTWDPWFADSAFIAEFSPQQEVPEAFMNWSSDQGHAGKAIVEDLLPDRTLAVGWYLEGWSGALASDWDFKRGSRTTTATWQMNGPPASFLARPLVWPRQNELVTRVQQGLEQLKQLVENQDEAAQNELAIERWEAPRWLLAVRDSADYGSVNLVTEQAYDRILEVMQNKVTQAGNSRYAIYHQWDRQLIDLTLAVPIRDSVALEAPFFCLRLPAGNYASAVHRGPHNRLPNTYTALQTWMQEQQLQPTGPPVEEYVSGPAGTAEEAQWVTRIYFPLPADAAPTPAL